VGEKKEKEYLYNC